MPDPGREVIEQREAEADPDQKPDRRRRQLGERRIGAGPERQRQEPSRHQQGAGPVDGHADGAASGLALLTPFVVITVHRFYRRANRGERDSPIAAVREDPVISISLGLFVIGLFTCLYAPGAEGLLERLIFPDAGSGS